MLNRKQKELQKENRDNVRKIMEMDVLIFYMFKLTVRNGKFYKDTINRIIDAYRYGHPRIELGKLLDFDPALNKLSYSYNNAMSIVYTTLQDYIYDDLANILDIDSFKFYLEASEKDDLSKPITLKNCILCIDFLIDKQLNMSEKAIDNIRKIKLDRMLELCNELGYDTECFKK